MRKILSCEFNPDTACVELCMDDGTLLSIDFTVVENEMVNSTYQSEKATPCTADNYQPYRYNYKEDETGTLNMSRSQFRMLKSSHRK